MKSITRGYLKKRRPAPDVAFSRKHQWSWFVGLWAGGVLSAALLAYGVKWVLRVL